MPDYVYALHDFLPENDDELTFKAGDRVEVVEKDDAYGDGWWKGRNLDGRIGLFPASYTTPASPAPPADEDNRPQNSAHNKYVLNTLPEESESGSPRPQDVTAQGSTNHIHSPVPKIPPVQFLNEDHDYESTSPVKPSLTQQSPQRGHDEVMQATLTDVQEAIEQLGKRQHGENDFDGSRSFSFASSRDTDTDFDLSDLEGPNGHAGAPPGTGEVEDEAEGWHKNAREKLAAKARKAVEEAEKLEAMISGSDRRKAMPPIEVDVSDESDDESEEYLEGHTTTTSSRIMGIPEEDEGVEADQDPPFMRHRIKSINDRQGSASAAVESAKAPQPTSPGGGVSLSLAEQDDTQPATATRPTFPPHITSASSPFESSTRTQTPQLQRPDATSTAPSFPGTTSALQSNGSVISAPVPSNRDQHPPTMRETPPEQQNARHGTPLSSSSSVLPPSATEASFSSNSMSLPTQRSSSPPMNASNAPLAAPTIKRASVLSALSGNSGHSIRSSLPPASAEPSSPLPPIPLDIVPASTQRQHSRVSSPAIFGNSRVASPSPLNGGGAGATVNNGTLSPLSIGEEGLKNGKQIKEAKHPTEWSVDEVVEWLRSKGFDQDVCDRFTEQEITGDVLLDLDVNLLKSEIGILAFGKRMRISNAISDLRRPPSLSYSDSHTQHNQPLSRLLSQQGSHSPLHSTRSSQSQQPQPPPQQQNDGGIGLYTPVSPQSQLHPHSRTQSQSHSSISGFIPPAGAPGAAGMQQQLQPQQPLHGHSNSVQSSLGSPFGSMPLFQQQQQQGLQHAYGGAAPRVDVGLGIVANGVAAVPGQFKPRPTSLSLSPSDSALRMSTIATDEPLVAHSVQSLPEEERGHMSDGEIAAISKPKVKRSIWTGSSSTRSSLKRGSKESPVGAQFSEKDKSEVGMREKDKESVSSMSTKRSKAKKNVEGNESVTAFTKASERLSIFGGTFTGRSRKPPPSVDPGDEKVSNMSKFSLGRLASHKRTSVNPSGGSFIDFSPQSTPKTLARDPSVLRKRTHSSGSLAVHGASPVAPGSTLSPLLSIGDDATPVVGGDTSTVGAHASAVGFDTPTVVGGDTLGVGDDDHYAGGSDPALDDSPVRGSSPTTVGDDATAINRTTPTATLALAKHDRPNKGSGIVEDGRSILEQIGEPDHAGWMRKRGGGYNAWRTRYIVLKGSHLYWMRSNSKQEKTIKGYVHVLGYKVSVDETLDPGRYGFRIDHDHDRTHCFSSDEKSVVRDWTKAIMKATIDRDYTKPVVSSCNIPTIPLTVAQAMNPAPRPPSPTARAATQKALRRDNPDQLSSRDAEILMGLNSPRSATTESSYHQFDMSSPTSLITASNVTTKLSSLNPPGPPPPRPSREMRRQSSVRSTSILSATEEPLVEWANGYLPPYLQIIDSPYAPLCSGLTLLRLAEAIKGKPASPPVPDSAFPEDETDDKLEGLFRLFDFLLDNDVKMGSVSINDVKCGRRDKIIQLLKGLKAWDEKRRAIIQSIGKSPVQAAGFIAF